MEYFVKLIHLWSRKKLLMIKYKKFLIRMCWEWLKRKYNGNKNKIKPIIIIIIMQIIIKITVIIKINKLLLIIILRQTIKTI